MFKITFFKIFLVEPCCLKQMDSRGAATATTSSAWAGYLLLYYIHSVSRLLGNHSHERTAKTIIWAFADTSWGCQQGVDNPWHFGGMSIHCTFWVEGGKRCVRAVQGPLAGQGCTGTLMPLDVTLWVTHTFEHFQAGTVKSGTGTSGAQVGSGGDELCQHPAPCPSALWEHAGHGAHLPQSLTRPCRH